jgi:hypothetical protein
MHAHHAALAETVYRFPARQNPGSFFMRDKPRVKIRQTDPKIVQPLRPVPCPGVYPMPRFMTS